MYFVRLCTISDFNQLILVAAKADFHRMFNAGVPVGLRSGINEVVMVYMGHTVKLAAADNGLFIYRICTGYVQCYRIEGGKHSHIRNDGNTVFGMAVAVGGNIHYKADMEVGAIRLPRLCCIPLFYG